MDKQISVWKGDSIPPTEYHLWVKPNGHLLIRIQKGNTSEWVLFNSVSLSDDINLYKLFKKKMTRALAIQTMHSALAQDLGIFVHKGMKVRYLNPDGVWEEMIYATGCSSKKHKDCSCSKEDIEYLSGDWKDWNSTCTKEMKVSYSIKEIPSNDKSYRNYILQDLNGWLQGDIIKVPKECKCTQTKDCVYTETITKKGDCGCGSKVTKTITIKDVLDMLKKKVDKDELGNIVEAVLTNLTVDFVTKEQLQSALDLLKNELLEAIRFATSGGIQPVEASPSVVIPPANSYEWKPSDPLHIPSDNNRYILKIGE